MKRQNDRLQDYELRTAHSYQTKHLQPHRQFSKVSKTHLRRKAFSLDTLQDGVTAIFSVILHCARNVGSAKRKPLFGPRSVTGGKQSGTKTWLRSPTAHQTLFRVNITLDLLLVSVRRSCLRRHLCLIGQENDPSVIQQSLSTDQSTLGFHFPSTTIASPAPGHGGMTTPSATRDSCPNDRNWK